MMIHLSQTPPNMSSIWEVCDSLGKTFLTLLLGNLRATAGLRVNSSPVKVKIIIFPLFLPEGNAILPMTAKAACVLVMLRLMRPLAVMSKKFLKSNLLSLYKSTHIVQIFLFPDLISACSLIELCQMFFCDLESGTSAAWGLLACLRIFWHFQFEHFPKSKINCESRFLQKYYIITILIFFYGAFLSAFKKVKNGFPIVF